MAYNDIVISRISTGAPITQDLMTDLRDNPIAIANGDANAPRIKKDAVANDDIAAGSGTIIPIVFTRASRGGASAATVTAYTLICTMSGTYNYFARIERDDTTSSATISLRVKDAPTSLVSFSEPDLNGQQEGTVTLTAGTSYEIRIDENHGDTTSVDDTLFFFNLGVSLQTAVGMGTAIAWEGINFEPNTDGIFVQ